MTKRITLPNLLRENIVLFRFYIYTFSYLKILLWLYLFLASNKTVQLDSSWPQSLLSNYYWNNNSWQNSIQFLSNLWRFRNFMRGLENRWRALMMEIKPPLSLQDFFEALLNQIAIWYFAVFRITINLK